MRKVGCRPPYWEMQSTIPNCTSNEQLESLGKFVMSNLLRDKPSIAFFSRRTYVTEGDE
jgi:hypothetical protein